MCHYPQRLVTSSGYLSDRLLVEFEHDMENYQDCSLSYQPKQSVEVDNTNQSLDNL